MNTALIDRIVQALLYEGYALYPYRPSIKSVHRWTFGGIYPPAWTADHPDDRSAMQAQCIVLPEPETHLQVSLRFLQPYEEHGSQKARERRIDLDPIDLDERLEISSRGMGFQPMVSDQNAWARCPCHELEGKIQISADNIDGALLVTVRVENHTLISPEIAASRDQTMLRSLASSHIVLHVDHGQFISLTDPPQPLRALASTCQNIGCWPVLIGEPGETDTLLASPIIVPDYPQIAAQSPGDLFDGTEIDEILTLRILTLTDDEKRQAAAVDDRVKNLLARTENIAREQLMNLHGTWGASSAHTFKPGDKVILHPKKRSDILDVAFVRKTATISAVEHDYENKTHLAVTIDDDPGKDLGVFGHRFFFSPEEVEMLPQPPVQEGICP